MILTRLNDFFKNDSVFLVITGHFFMYSTNFTTVNTLKFIKVY